VASKLKDSKLKTLIPKVASKLKDFKVKYSKLKTLTPKFASKLTPKFASKLKDSKPKSSVSESDASSDSASSDSAPSDSASSDSASYVSDASSDSAPSDSASSDSASYVSDASSDSAPSDSNEVLSKQTAVEESFANQYKTLIRKENENHLSDVKLLASLAKKTIKIENERSRLQAILTKLKGTLPDSQTNDFNIMFKEVISIFDSRVSKC
jgi:hypothetical protein